jgi:hypothetical protein
VRVGSNPARSTGEPGLPEGFHEGDGVDQVALSPNNQSKGDLMATSTDFRNAADKLMDIKQDIDALDFGDVEELREAKEGIIEYIAGAHAGLSLMFTISSLCEMTGIDMEEQAAQCFSEIRDEQQF